VTILIQFDDNPQRHGGPTGPRQLPPGHWPDVIMWSFLETDLHYQEKPAADSYRGK
jgi:hypothetical protein